MTGGDKCNASCPYCVTKMVKNHVSEATMNWHRFNIACNYAVKSGVKRVMLGGIGEPTLYPDFVTKVLEELVKYEFPLIEIETNGSLISSDEYDKRLEDWLDYGLTTIQVAVTSHDSKVNSDIMRMPYYNINSLIEKLHDIGYSVRLSCVLFKGGVDNASKLEELINYSITNHVDQLLIRKLVKPYSPSGTVSDWVNSHTLSNKFFKKFLNKHGTKLLSDDGTHAYDVSGQCVILVDDSKISEQLILFPGGAIRYRFNYKGAVLL